MGRYSKKRKQEEARMRAEDAKKTFVENILKLSEKQLEELERLERRINRKKILINKKYGAAYDKIQKEEREKRQKIFEKYDIYGYITKYFEALHTMGDNYIVQDIDDYIANVVNTNQIKA